jgi:hypothetical protein
MWLLTLPVSRVQMRRLINTGFSRKDEGKRVMISESRIYRSAQVLIDQHQECAFSEAMVRMETYWMADNEDEMNIWRWIANTIHMIQMSSRCAGYTIH